jgi:hypothetical protein
MKNNGEIHRSTQYLTDHCARHDFDCDIACFLSTTAAPRSTLPPCFNFTHTRTHSAYANKQTENDEGSRR